MSFLDPNGDLCIQVGKSPVISFIVCSKTLVRTSDFWNKLLNGEFKESRDSTVELPEDDPRPMALLLNIVHGRFDQVPGYQDVMDIQYLYNISVLTDKYAMTHVLRPWAPGWLRSRDFLGEKPDVSLREQYCHERLWISWELGDKANFEKIANILLLKSSTSTEGANSLRCDGVLEPPDIYEILEQTRLDMIEALLTPLNDIIQRLIRKDEEFCDEDDCLGLMLGTCIQSLYSNGLWPIPQPADVPWSVSDLSAKLKTIEINGNNSVYHFCSHGSALKDKVEGVLSSIPSLLTEVHYRHLDSQAMKSGLGPIKPNGVVNGSEKEMSKQKLNRAKRVRVG
ncbi:hypothetical protein GGR58DRAFT_464593 [Xylaria digitata]|nr:hypothetical protein GGR58DRAFT_464593 [Xylaria digitata]